MSGVASREPSSTRSTSTASPHASLRQPAKHRADGRLLVARDDDRQASRSGWSTAARQVGASGAGDRSAVGSSGRPRAAAGAGTPQQLRRSSAPARGPSAARAETAPGTAPRPQTTNGTGRSPQSRWPWPPMPRPWPWSAMRITVASSSLPRSSRKSRKSPTWRSVSASWSRYSAAPHAAHVAELVGRQQLEHEQVRVLLVHHPARLGGQRAVDLGGRLHRRDGPDHVLAERIEQVRDPHEPAAAAMPFEHVEDRLAPNAEPRREVRAHAVLGRRGAR